MARELREGVWCIDLGHVNAFLVEDDILTLVDAGMPWHAGRLRREIETVGQNVSAIDRVLITHYDLDHVGGLGRLAELDADVHVGERDADLVAGRRSPPLTNRKTAFQRVTDWLRRPPEVPITPVSDGDQLGTFEAIHTPGHTMGHVAYASGERDVAFVGDLVMSDGASLSPSPWYLSADTAAVSRSIERLVERIPEVRAIGPGHGDPLAENGYAALEAASR